MRTKPPQLKPAQPSPDEDNISEAGGWRVDSAATTPRAYGGQPAHTLPPNNLPVTSRKISAAVFRALLSRTIQAERDRGRIFLFLPLFMGLGAAFWFALDETPPLAGIVASLFVCTFILLYQRARRSISLVAKLSAAVFLGMLLAQLETWRYDTVILDSPVTASVQGRIIDMERARSGRWRYTLDIISITDPVLRRPPERVRITGLAPKADVAPGDILVAPARLSPPSGPVLPGGYDFAFGNYYAGIGAVGYFYGYPQKQDNLPPSSAETISNRLSQLQAAASLFLVDRMSRVLSGDTLSFASAIAVNDRRALSLSAMNALRESGLAHIIAISGLHMALAGGLFFWVLRAAFAAFPALCERYAVKKIAAFGALLAASTYLFMSGAPISATRAYIMLATMLIAVMVGRPAFNLRNLAIAAIIIIAVMPSAVISPGFLMSFGATAALIAGYNIWRPANLSSKAEGNSFGPLRYLATFGRFAAGLALTSAIGASATALFAAATFNTLPKYGLIANLLVMPIFSFLVMPTMFLAMLMAPLGLERPFLHVLNVGLETCLAIAHWVAGFDGPLLTGQVPVWVSAIGAIALFSGCIFRSMMLRTPLLGLYFASVIGVVAMAGMQQGPDMLIYEDGRLLALNQNHTLSFNRDRPASFVADQWQKALGAENTRKTAEIEEPIEGLRGNIAQFDLRHFLKAGESDVPIFHCAAKKWCAAMVKEVVVMNIVEPQHIGFACDNADIVVSPWRHPYTKCRSGARVLDADTLRRNGSIALSVAGSADTGESGNRYTLISAMEDGNRAWTKHRLYDWRTGKFDAPERHKINGIGE